MSSPVRILHLRACNFLGGPERQLLRYAEFDRAGPVEIILGTFVGAREGREFARAIDQRGLNLLALPAGRVGDLRALVTLTRYVAEREISLICTHGYQADMMATMLGFLHSVPVAWFPRGWTGEDWKVRIYDALDRTLLPLATRVVCLSETQAKRLAHRRSLRHKTRVVVNAIEARMVSEEERVVVRREICERFNLPEDSPLVATAGRLSPEKGAIRFVEAVPAIRKQFPTARFVVFGGGPLRAELERAARELGPAGEVYFTGHVPDFAQLLPGIDTLVNPSLSEEMPNVVLEAMAAGVPVVATNVGGVAEIAGNGGLVLIPPADPKAIAQAVSTLLNDRSYAQEQGRAGQRRVCEAFSPARQRAQLHALYEELIPSLRKLGSTPSGYNETRFVGAGLAPAEDDARVGSTQSAERSRGEKTPTATATVPFISIVIPVHNEGVHLGSVLKDLVGQDYPRDRYEILVVDGNSTDDTAAVAGRYASDFQKLVRLHSNPLRLSSAGRNVGVRASRGEIIVFIDGHCLIPSPGLLLETAHLLKKTGADCLCRPQPLTLSSNTLLQDVIAHTRATALGHGRDSTIYEMEREGFVNPTSSGASYRRSVFDRVGMYDEDLDACEDVEFNYRLYKAGFCSYLSPSLAVFYHPRASLLGLFKQLVRYGRGRLRFIRKHHDAVSISQLVPPSFIAWLVVGGLVSVSSVLIREALLMTLAAYAGLVLGFSAVLGYRHGWRHFIVGPAVYFTIHLGLGTGFWAELLQRRHRSTESAGSSESNQNTNRM